MTHIPPRRPHRLLGQRESGTSRPWEWKERAGRRQAYQLPSIKPNTSDANAYLRQELAGREGTRRCGRTRRAGSGALEEAGGSRHVERSGDVCWVKYKKQKESGGRIYSQNFLSWAGGICIRADAG